MNMRSYSFLFLRTVYVSPPIICTCSHAVAMRAGQMQRTESGEGADALSQHDGGREYVDAIRQTGMDESGEHLRAAFDKYRAYAGVGVQRFQRGGERGVFHRIGGDFKDGDSPRPNPRDFLRMMLRRLDGCHNERAVRLAIREQRR
jgi:hypothetical protein